MTNLEYLRTYSAEDFTGFLTDIASLNALCLVCAYPRNECSDKLCYEGVEEWLNKERE